MMMGYPMAPGPRPNSKCPKDIHYIPKPEHRHILDLMGSGGASAKIHALVEREGRRQLPREKRLLKAKWILLRHEAQEAVRISQAARSLMIEIGFTEEEVRRFEDEELEYG
jgi:hypothetical protein